MAKERLAHLKTSNFLRPLNFAFILCFTFIPLHQAFGVDDCADEITEAEASGVPIGGGTDACDDFASVGLQNLGVNPFVAPGTAVSLESFSSGQQHETINVDSVSLVGGSLSESNTLADLAEASPNAFSDFRRRFEITGNQLVSAGAAPLFSVSSTITSGGTQTGVGSTKFSP